MCSAYLDENDVRYTPKPTFIGQSGFSHTFDFVIPHSRSKPERLVSAVNELSKPLVGSQLFAWSDTHTQRKAGSQYYIIVNDAQHPADETLVAALKNYQVHPVLWTDRDEVLGELAA